ncbi:hypothetical protein KSB_88800 [Ktedonobacter robiniae]|uniref:Uncharacterized protein n=1 Tax=Ktedonobacter robiniae TaxID=2778365 RepID=A0ABQ3V6A3_9CHLR|nr:hypothetical protein KSB_88800 [Ktedonobacter robiniae]
MEDREGLLSSSEEGITGRGNTPERETLGLDFLLFKQLFEAQSQKAA